MLLHQYLERNADRHADKPAVRDAVRALTYAQLDARANRHARALGEAGVRPGGRVGVYFRKSVEAVAGILGVLKAGCAYVPLDFDSPSSRTGTIAGDCRLQGLVTDMDGLRRLAKTPELFPAEWGVLVAGEGRTAAPVPTGWRMVSEPDIAAQPARAPDVPPASEDATAYILYTSGSTGRPKGVTLTHRNARVFVEWAVGLLGLRADDVFSSHAPFHFDLSIFDIYASLACGGTLCLLPPGSAYFPDAVLAFIEQNGITVWYSVPSALVPLLELKDDLAARMRTLRKLIYAGEVFPHERLDELRRQVSQAEVHNWYGPTETNVITYHVLPAGGEPLRREVPIGRACVYARLQVLGDDGQPVAPGEKGELVAAGDSLMAGYFGDPEKTARAIRPVRIGGVEERYYFTGDIVHEDAAGALLYAGRRDSMVKTRGFRVELGEVESALDRHPRVLKAAVIAIPDARITHRLKAFVALRNRGEATPGELIEHCHQLLPAYMVPEVVQLVDQLPLTSTGKIDREALRALSEREIP